MTEISKEAVEAAARAIDMTTLSDGDPIGVALAENFRIEDGCETAADVRRELDKVLFSAAEAALTAALPFLAPQPSRSDEEEDSADRLLLHRAMRELELIRMKDCDAVYDTTLRAEYSAILARK